MTGEKPHTLERTESQRGESVSVAFLLAEFSELGEFWRHTDARLESSLNFYLTAIAVLAPATLLLRQSVSDIRSLVALMIPVGIALFVIGILLTWRVTRAILVKAEYVHALNLIRRYFVDNDPHIAKYLFLPVAEPLGEARIISRHFRVSSQRRLTLIIDVANSLLLGAIVAATLWLLTTLDLTFIVLIGLSIAVTSFIVINWWERQAVQRYQALKRA
jgi:hypothetical protein